MTHRRKFGPVMVVVLAVLAALLPSGSSHVSATTSNAIQAENALAGDPSWDDFASVAQQDAISGYSSPISVNHGAPVDFYVTTTAASFTIDVFRMGWYAGAGARKVLAMGSFLGVHQAIPAPDKVTGMVECHWTKTTTLNVPSNWVSGVYLAKLSASNGNKSFIFFVVRDDGGTEALDFQTSVTTYQAYNLWGGVSLYDNQTNKSAYPYAAATKVSFDRPFDPLDNNGSGHFLAYEYPFLRWAEKNGYDMTYTTNIDTATNVNPLTNHRAFLSVGHDEYWSRSMRENVQNAVNAGVNAAFFSANTAYWQIRLEPDSAGNPSRTEVGYKDNSLSTSAPGPDPQWGVNNSVVTVRWRDDPVNQPENGLLGVMYQDQVQQSYPYVVQNSSNWIYAGTGFTDGASVPGVVGYEYDKVWNNGATPPGITVLSNSPVVGCCEGSGHSFANSTLYTAPSGARVFAAGTIQWSWGLDNYSASYADPRIQRTTANILDAFGSGSPVSAPAVTLSPTALTFGSQRVGTSSASQQVTLTNSGNDALAVSSISMAGANASDFGQTSNCPISPVTIAPGGSCSISVTFAPTAAGSRSASLSIGDNASGSPQTVSLTGTGTAPTVRLSPASLTFAGQTVGTTSTAQNVTLTNTGSAPLAISAVSVTGTSATDFGESDTCPRSPTTVTAGAACTISVTFTPSALGTRTAAVTVTDDAAGSPQSVALTGTGATAPAPAVTLSPASLNFGSQTVGTSSPPGAVTLTNSGTAPLTIASMALSGDAVSDYSFVSTCPTAPSTLAAGAQCGITVTFAPTTTGARTATITVNDDAADSPQQVSLAGSGTLAAPSVSLTPSALTFGSQTLGTSSAAQSVTLKNSGTADLTITGISLTGANAADFTQSNNCPIFPFASTALPAGSSCTVSVTFTPSGSGARTATLTVSDNAADSPQSVGISGSGATASLFSDGFESAALPGAWTGTRLSTGNTLSLDNTLERTGKASLKAVKVRGKGGNAYIYKTISGQSALDVRAYYDLRSPANYGDVPLMTLYAQGNFIGWVSYYVDPTSPSLSVYNGANNVFYTCSTLPSLNTWHSIELQYSLSTTATGWFKLWVDGAQVCGATGVRTSPSSGLTVNQVRTGVDGADTTAGLSVNVDDVVISKSYIGA